MIAQEHSWVRQYGVSPRLSRYTAALTDADAQLVQLLGHARPAIAAKAQAMLVADMGQENHVAPLAT